MLNLKRFALTSPFIFSASDYSVKQHIKVSHLYRADQTENSVDRGIAHPLHKHAFMLCFRHFLNSIVSQENPVLWTGYLVIPHES